MKIFQVDAFTGEPFKGNPAGVCLLENAKPDFWMQSVAAEMNLSETAFILREKDMFNLRWFTPKTYSAEHANGLSFFVVPRRVQEPSRNDKFRRISKM